MQLILIRHGEMAGEPFVQPTRPVSGCLSESGIAQVETARDRLSGWSCDHVFSSPYGRALQTAEILFTQRGVPTEVLPFLHEWLPNPDGEAPGATAIPVEERLYAEETWKTEAGEGCFEMYSRIGPPFLKALATQGIHRRHGGYVPDSGAEERRIAVVAHGGSLNVLLSFLLGVSPTPVGLFTFDLTGTAQIQFQRFRDVYYPRLRLPAAWAP
jgi:broad specificity phosphatase PhoE